LILDSLELSLVMDVQSEGVDMDVTIRRTVDGATVSFPLRGVSVSEATDFVAACNRDFDGVFELVGE
jgi:hypothetical protein